MKQLLFILTFFICVFAYSQDTTKLYAKRQAAYVRANQLLDSANKIFMKFSKNHSEQTYQAFWKAREKYKEYYTNVFQPLCDADRPKQSTK